MSLGPMSAESRPLAAAAVRHHGEPVPAKVLTILLVCVLFAFAVASHLTPLAYVLSNWPGLLFWTVLIVVVNLWPLSIGEITLTLDMPLLLTVALLYPPDVAAAIGVLAALDIREVGRSVPLTRAVFNRAQVGSCVLAASLAFHAVSNISDAGYVALLGTLSAVGAFHFVNMALVATYTWLRIGSWNRFTIGEFGQFVVIYAGYGLIALLLARLFVEVGPWSVVWFLLPIGVARQALVRSQRLQGLTDDLRRRERLLDRLFDRLADERRDERIRIASELHDEVLQSLIRVSQLSAFLVKEVPADTQAGKDATEIAAASRGAIEELRAVVSDLRKSPLVRGGLLPTLRSLIRDLELDWRVKIELEVSASGDLPPESQMILYQAAREGLLNALKHAGANTIRAVLVEGETEVSLVIEDDGKGFIPEEVDSSHHFGLGLIKERVGLSGGSFSIESEQGQGTRLLVSLPLDRQTDDPVPIALDRSTL